MKSAMQELIEWINSRIKMENEVVKTLPHPEAILKKATELLDKEKEQLRHAFLCGDNAVFHFEKDYTEDFKTFVKYYQKTYNQ